MSKKIIFIDRDGTLLEEPEDKQVDSIEKLRLKKNVIPALLSLSDAGYRLVIVSNQDGLGSESFKQNDFEIPQNFMLSLFQTQGIQFDDVKICPHFVNDNCMCRKPQLGLIMDYLQTGIINFEKSYMIGDRESDLEFARNMGIQSILYQDSNGWSAIATSILSKPRLFEYKRVTAETDIDVAIDLDQSHTINVKTGLRFFDHMLEQLAKHAGFGLTLNVEGDLDIDEHHTVEDVGIALGEAIRGALDDKRGIDRYGFVLPMDESLATIALDLSGRSYFVFEGDFKREKVGELPTELVSHFFRSLTFSLNASVHIKVIGENAHHMIESIFKGIGRTLRQAVNKQGYDLPTTKGVL